MDIVMHPPDDSWSVDERALNEVTRVARSTRRNWVGRLLPPDPPDLRFRLEDVLRTALVSEVVKAIGPRGARVLLGDCREEIVTAMVGASPGGRFDLILEVDALRCAVVTGDRALVARLPYGRPVILLALSEQIERSREAFERRRGTIAFDDRRRRCGASP